MNRPLTKSPGARLRPLASPHVLRVRADDEGRPRAVWFGRKWDRVEAIRESWRIDDEWWRDPVAREYHVVVLEGGRVATIYRDLWGSGWYRQG